MASYIPPQQSDHVLPYQSYPPSWIGNPSPNTNPNTVANPNPHPTAITNRNPNSDPSMNPNPNIYANYAPYPHDPYAGFGAVEAPPGVTINATSDQVSMGAWDSSSQNYTPQSYNIPQWTSQSSWENCLPPGVSPSSNLNLNPTNPHSVGAQPSLHFGQDPWTYGSEYMRPFDSAENSWATTWVPWPAPVHQKVWPKKKQKKHSDKKALPVKPVVMKKVAKEESPGWCALCQRDCVTEMALKQHLGGKPHKKKVTLHEKQLLEKQAEVIPSSAAAVPKPSMETGPTLARPDTSTTVSVLASRTLSDQTVGTAPGDRIAPNEDGKGVANILEELWVQMGKKEGKNKEKGVVVSGPAPAPAPAPASASAPASSPPKVAVTTYKCYVCNVQCNSQAILEMHFGGKKHASRLKLLQR